MPPSRQHDGKRPILTSAQSQSSNEGRSGRNSSSVDAARLPEAPGGHRGQQGAQDCVHGFAVPEDPGDIGIQQDSH